MMWENKLNDRYTAYKIIIYSAIGGNYKYTVDTARKTAVTI